MRKCVLLIVSVISHLALASVTVSNVSVEPMMPWGKVCIAFRVDGLLPDRADEAVINVSLTNFVTHEVSLASIAALSGDTGLSIGLHRVVWDLAKDNLVFSGLHAKFTVEYILPSPLYEVIDLSGGFGASSYPITTLKRIPDGGWTDEYKTSKFVLRRIEAGSYIMGSDQSDETHRVTLTNPFYIGVFEVTQRQWDLVMGNDTSVCAENANRPTQVSYYMIRGSLLESPWTTNNYVSADSFLGVLRAKTGLNFDLPTEAQWEYACRSGTVTTYSYGDNAEDKYMWYSANSDWTTHIVGTKIPNRWGLYDMHGNMCEWCIDWFGTMAYGTNPACYGTTGFRVLRGGGWYDLQCPSSWRGECNAWSSNGATGFRLSRTLSIK